jgi:drug/metabolite transporter (DMT)-like permease
MNWKVLAAWWIACLLWSGTFLFIKIGLSDVAPLTFGWLRLLIALAALLPLTVARRGFAGLSGHDVLHVMAAGVLLLGVNYGLIYWGTQFIPSGLVAILQSVTPVFALLFGYGLGLEAVTLRKAVALAAGAAGVIVIFRTELRATGMAAVGGSVAVVGGSACVAAAYVWVKCLRGRVHPFTLTTLQCAGGLVPLAAVALALEGSPLNASWTPRALGALLYLALGASVLAFCLNYWLLERMDTSAMLMMGVAEIPIAVALGALIAGERLPPGTLLGAACILSGVVLLLSA